MSKKLQEALGAVARLRKLTNNFREGTLSPDEVILLVEAALTDELARADNGRRLSRYQRTHVTRTMVALYLIKPKGGNGATGIAHVRGAASAVRRP